MRFRKSFIVLAAICLTCGVCIFVLSEPPSIDEEVIRQKREILLADSQQRQVPVVFYGKVVDLDGQPVKDVDVSLDIDTIDGVKIFNLKTDNNGLFSINSKGVMLSIRNISKDTYEYSIKRNPERSFEYSTFGGHYHVPDPAKPVVFYLRKRSHPNYTKDINYIFSINDYSTYESQEYLMRHGYYTPEGKEGILPNGKTKASSDSEDYRVQG
ncbi:MAG TPA: hypothetical protein PKC47_16385, partial [Petrimonas sp.]|nr:hypothetical protein [Petrimonas sp.]